jgi:Ca2+-transporting ATPase
MLAAAFHRQDGRLLASVKGAPDRLLERCDFLAGPSGPVTLDRDARAMVLRRNAELAGQGLRVLALARGEVAAADDASLRGLELLGLAGITDPPMPGVRETIAQFRAAGLRIVMLTGDQRLTALSIGRALDLLHSDAEALDGREIDLLDDATLADRLATVGVVSRISPEAKLRVVKALQQRGECVAMLGDGINDAAALRQADIGVAMGRRGADLAKEAADVVLLDDRFATIGAAIEQGRVIFDNIRHFVYYLFSCNLAEVLVFFGAAVARLGPPLLPLQILWLNLVTDTFPALALAVEPAEPGIMRRPPVHPRSRLLPARLTLLTLADAALIAAVSLAAFMLGRHDPARAITLAFNTLAIAQLLHLGNARSRESVLGWRRIVANPAALAAVLGVVALQVVATQWVPVARALQLTPLDGEGWLLVMALSSLPALAGQLRRSISSREHEASLGRRAAHH